MAEIRYMISDVSKMLNTQASVLRYFEYHLSLNIKRTELGHRYYTQDDIDLLSSVKALKDKGFDLKVIKAVLPYIDKVKNLDPNKMLDMKERLEMALGLCGTEAKENLRSQYGKVIEIDMANDQPVVKTSNQPVHGPAAASQQGPAGKLTSGPRENKQNLAKAEHAQTILSNAKEVNQYKNGAQKPTIEIVKQNTSNDPVTESFTEPVQTVDEKNKGMQKEHQVSRDNRDNSYNIENQEKPLQQEEQNLEEQNKIEDLSKRLAVIENQGKNEVNQTASKLSQEKLDQFRKMMTSIVNEAIQQNNQSLTQDINEVLTDSIVKELDYMLQLREEREEQKAEERFRQLDRTLRETVVNRQQAAATKESGKKKPSKFFKKNKVHI